MKKPLSKRALEEARESELAAKSPNYLRSIKQARSDFKAGRIRDLREVFKMNKRAKKKSEVVLNLALDASDLAELRILAKKRRCSVDSLASSVIRRYAKGRLI